MGHYAIARSPQAGGTGRQCQGLPQGLDTKERTWTGVRMSWHVHKIYRCRLVTMARSRARICCAMLSTVARTCADIGTLHLLMASAAPLLWC